MYKTKISGRQGCRHPMLPEILFCTFGLTKTETVVDAPVFVNPYVLDCESAVFKAQASFL